MHRIRWTVYPYILYLFLYQNNHKQTLRFTYSFPLFFLFSSCSSLEQRSRLWGLLLCQDNNSLWGHRLSHPIIAKPSTDLDLGARPLCWNRPAPERAPLRTQEQKSQCVRSTCGIYRSKCLWCQISVFFFFFLSLWALLYAILWTCESSYRVKGQIRCESLHSHIVGGRLSAVSRKSNKNI